MMDRHMLTSRRGGRVAEGGGLLNRHASRPEIDFSRHLQQHHRQFSRILAHVANGAPVRAVRKSAQRLALSAAVLLAAGCDGYPDPPGWDGRESLNGLVRSEWIDRESGCRYIALSERTFSRYVLCALAPKLRPDGSPDCGRAP